MRQCQETINVNAAQRGNTEQTTFTPYLQPLLRHFYFFPLNCLPSPRLIQAPLNNSPTPRRRSGGWREAEILKCVSIWRANGRSVCYQQSGVLGGRWLLQKSGEGGWRGRWGWESGIQMCMWGRGANFCPILAAIRGQLHNSFAQNKCNISQISSKPSFLYNSASQCSLLSKVPVIFFSWITWITRNIS